MASDALPKPPARPKPSGRKAKKLSQKDQSERFIETARELNADERKDPFERAIRAILPRKIGP
jgi:hypothetical protein